MSGDKAVLAYLEKLGLPLFSCTLRTRNVTANTAIASTRSRKGTNHFGSSFDFNSLAQDGRSICIMLNKLKKLVSSAVYIVKETE